jgi:hypothetical protein
MALNTIGTRVISDTTATDEVPLLPTGSVFTSIRSSISGCLICDGSALSRTTFAKLFSVMPFSSATVTTPIASPGIVTWTSHGLTTGREFQLTTTGTLPTGINGANVIYFVRVINANTFHVYDTLANAMNTASTTGRINFTGSSSGTHTATSYVFGNGISGVLTHFSLPDFRGVVPRGSGITNGYVASATIIAGEKTGDVVQGHRHSTSVSHDARAGGGGYAGGAFGASDSTATISVSVLDATTDGTNGTPRTGIETRVKSLGINYFIKVI